MEASCRSFLALTQLAVEQVLNGFAAGSDGLILSVAYTWRHYIELRLKLLVVAADMIRGRPRRLLRGHVLSYWWKLARENLQDVFANEDHATHLPPVDVHVAELDRLDPQGVTFRYTIEQNGATAMPEGLVGLDWIAFAAIVDDVSGTLEGAAGMFADAVQYALDNRGS